MTHSTKAQVYHESGDAGASRNPVWGTSRLDMMEETNGPTTTT